MSATPSRRRPWLAAVLSAVLPGFGQFYAGDANRALGFFLVFGLLSVPVTVIGSLYLPIRFTTPAVALATLAAIGVWLYGIVDAWRLARRHDPFVPAAWQTLPVYATVFLLCAFVLLPSIIGYVRQHQVQPFYIPSNSMNPALLPGDLLFADMRYNCPGCVNEVQRGDVAIFVYPDNRNLYYVKRIVALAGDAVAIDAGSLRVNGTAVSQTLEADATMTFAQHTVAPGHVFVLGDNRSASRDSRDFGDVPLSDVVGRPRQIWFSYGEDGVRWSRIGLAVQEGD